MHELLSARVRTDTRADVSTSRRGHSIYDRAYCGKLDSEGWPLAFEVYAPAVVAHYVGYPALVAGVDLFRGATGLLARTHGSTEPPTLVSSEDARRSVLTALRALPEVHGAAQPYRDLRLLAAIGSPSTLGAYLDLIVAAVRTGLPRWRATTDSSARPSARPRAERAREQRAAERIAEEASAEWWLREYLADADPGSRVSPAHLHKEASEAIEEFDGDPIDETDERSPTFRTPGSRTFYRVADSILGARRRANGADYYLISIPSRQEPPMDHIAEQVVDRVVDTLAVEVIAEHGESLRALIRSQFASGNLVGALHLQRQSFAATGTDGAVLSFADAQARRTNPS